MPVTPPSASTSAPARTSPARSPTPRTPALIVRKTSTVSTGWRFDFAARASGRRRVTSTSRHSSAGAPVSGVRDLRVSTATTPVRPRSLGRREPRALAEPDRRLLLRWRTGLDSRLHRRPDLRHGGGNVPAIAVTRTAQSTVDAGENVTCTFTNTKDASLIVRKTTVGGVGEFDFAARARTSPRTSTSRPSWPAPRSPARRSTSTAPINQFGVKLVTETCRTGYDLTNLSCSGDTTDLVIGTLRWQLHPRQRWRQRLQCR